MGRNYPHPEDRTAILKDLRELVYQGIRFIQKLLRSSFFSCWQRRLTHQTMGNMT